MKKILFVLVVFLSIIGFSFAAGTSEKGTGSETGKKIPIAVATASMGGTYYPVGVGIAEILNTKVASVEARVEVTGGTVENPGLVNSGNSEIGLANTDMAYYALNGQSPFKEKMPNLRGLFNGLAPGVVHYVVMENSGINKLADLKGKRIAVGPQGNSTSLFFRNVILELGMTWEDIKPSYLSFSDGVSALIDGKVDMAIVAAGLPSPAIKEIAATKKAFKILEFDNEFASAFLKKYPFYIRYNIPASTYGLKADVQTVATQNMVMINSLLNEKLVYEITKAIFENIDILYKSHPSATNVKLESAWNTPIPLHPGAEKYFKEKGVIK